jgi:hypothetical protein
MSTDQPDCTQFAFDQVEQAIDGIPTQSRLKDEAYAIAARGAHEYIRWLILGPDRPGCVSTDRPYMPIIAKRAVAAAWVISPALFAGKSMREVARSVGMSKSQLDTLMGQFGFIFRMHGRGQLPAAVRRRYAGEPTSAVRRRRETDAHYGPTGKANRGKARK